jgi:hypothetical protein
MRHRLRLPLVFFPVLLLACGGKQAVLSNTLRAMEATSSAVLAYADAEEGRIVAAATSEADGKARLAAFRAKVDKFHKMLAMTAAVLGLATADDVSYEQGLQLAVQLFTEAKALLGGAL